MADSRRINGNIREEESKLSEGEQPSLFLSSIILSSEFWPPLKEEKLELPPLVLQAMEAYTHRYEKLKVFTCCSSVVVFNIAQRCCFIYCFSQAVDVIFRNHRKSIRSRRFL